MNRLSFFLAIVLIVFVNQLSFSQRDVIISSGYNISSLVCSNNNVFVVGSNKTDMGTGLLGTGNNADYVNTWEKVNFPNSETIRQVTCGSGSHFVAISCEGSVWCWGKNTYGQCGTGSRGGIVTTPQKVVAGCLAGTAYDCDGYLCNVDVVSAGVNNSFAILGEGPYKGMVIAWGGNMADNDYTSCLGTGRNTGNAAPEWCIDLQGNKIKNIVDVYSGPDVTLVLDADGYVWSCGGQMMGENILGRKASGGYTASNNNNSSNSFGLLYVATGIPLSNIKQIAVGGVNCHALDINGYVWGWGDAWNSACGIGENQYSSYPRKVIAGLLDLYDTDGTYLLAKSISAGLSCGFAVTITGKPIMWGQFSTEEYGNSNQPRYVEYVSGRSHDDVVSVSRGDNWGYYSRSDGSLYAWGSNEYGQLGIGNTTSQAYAVKINPPTSCEFKAPTPTASITPKSVTVCAASEFSGTIFDCGFSTSANLMDNYKITWYKDGVQVSTGNGSNTTYETSSGANGLGTYKVIVEYVGSSGGCSSYDPIEDEVTISAYEPEFSVDESSRYCGDVATVKIMPSGSTAEYTWFASQAGTTELGKSIGDEEITIDVSSIVENSNEGKTIYVQETSMGSGLFLPEKITNWKGSSDICTAYGEGLSSSMYATGFYVKEPVTLTSLSFYAGASTYSGETNTTLTFTVYEAKSGSYGFIPNTSTQPYGTFMCTEIITSTSSNTQKYTAIGSVSLNEGLYFIVPTELESTNASIQYNLYRGNSSLATTNVDDLTGNILQFQSVVSSEKPINSSGYIFDITFTVGQKYCGIVPVTLTQNCPCTPPDDFNIRCSDASLYTGDSIYICENIAQCTLTTDEWASSGSNFEYIWYKDGVAGTSSVANTSAAYSVTGAGVYKILVRDKNSPNATSCQLEKSVTVFLNPVPTVTVAGGGEICEGEELLNPVTFTMTGEPRFRVYWDFTDQTGTTRTKNKLSTAYTVEVQTPTAVGVYTYTVKSVIDDANCKNEQVSGTATITIKPIPSVEITTLPEPEVCEGEVVVLTASSNQSDVSYVWHGKENGFGETKTLVNPNESGTYNVTASLNGCSSEAVSVDVTIHEKPEISSVTSEMSSVCSGETITMTATTSDEGDGTFSWSGNGVTGNGATATMSNIVTDDTEITITSNYTSMYGCNADPKTLDLIIYAIPESPIVENVSYYENMNQSDVLALSATSSKNGTLYWYGKNATGGVSSTIAPTPQIMDGTSTYYVSQKVNGCESDRAPLTVTILQAPVIISTSLPKIDLSDGDSLPTITLSDYFAVENQTISYSATSSDNSVVYPVVIGDKLELIQYGAGTTTIEISATVDGSLAMVTESFTITIEPASQPQLCDLSIESDITNVTCFGGKDGKIEISVSNGAEPYHYKWNTGRTSNGIYDVPVGEYSVLVWDSVGCSTTKTFQIKEPSEIVVIETITNPSCGQSNGAISVEISGGTAPYSQIWSLSNSDAASVITPENLQSNVYKVQITDGNNCRVTKTYALQESNAPSITLKSVNASKCNEATGNCEIEISSDSPYSVVWSDSTEVWNATKRPLLLPGTYTVTVSDENNCRSVLGIEVTAIPIRQPEIALVTVGKESGKNLIIWQKTETDAIKKYTIWREGDESGVYNKLGDVPFSETSIFVDPDANIMEQSWRYKISATDVCNNETPLSKEHKTIHLQKSRGLDGEVNLVWDSYEGIEYASYLIYRQTRSNSELDMFKKIPASLNRYTDMNPPADVIGYYVAVLLPEAIDENKTLKAESGPFVLAISNIAEIENGTNISNYEENQPVVYTKDNIIFVYDANGEDVIISDIAGNIVAQASNVTATAIPVKTVGIYVVVIGGKAFKVLVK